MTAILDFGGVLYSNGI